MKIIEHLIDISKALLALIGVFLTAVYGPKAVTKMQGKQKLNEVKTEGEVSEKSLYIGGMGELLNEYSRQVEGFKNELAAVKKEFAEFREQHEKKVIEYESKIIFLEVKVDELEDKNEELETLVVCKDTIIRELKGDI